MESQEETAQERKSWLDSIFENKIPLTSDRRKVERRSGIERRNFERRARFNGGRRDNDRRQGDRRA